jgi:hypothetical protein
MHDRDRTALEYRALDQEADQYEFADEFADELDSEGEAEAQDEEELVYEFASVSDEGELDQFIGNLLKKAGRKFGNIVRSPIGQALAPYLKGAAKKYLPMAGGAIGGLVGGATGRRLGGQLASKAGGLLGFEGEGEYDGEIESARAFIEFANEAVKTAAAVAGSGQSPQAVAKTAVIAAAKKRAPNLLKGGSGNGTCSCGGRQSSGRWYRRGRRIVLAGV